MSKKIPDLDSNEFSYPNSSGITSQETFLATHYTQRPAKNPLFEAISLLVPTGRINFHSNLAMFKANYAITITGKKEWL
jgi:hypothetical protein